MNGSEINYKNLVNNLTIGIFRCTPGPKGRFIFANTVLLSMMGYSEKEFLKLHVSGIFKDNKRFRDLNGLITRQGYAENEEAQLVSKDKKIFYCSISAVVVNDDKGDVKWIDGIVEDITVQKRVEKELIESKELFKTVFNNSAAAITVTDKHEKIVAWNPFAERILGMTKEDLFNKPVKDLYPQQEWRRMRAFQIRRKGMLSDIETKVYKKDGSVIDVNMSISVLKDMEGNVIGSIGIMNDITKQKIAERKIKESENKIRIIFENTAAAIMLTDENERIISWNKHTEQLLGKKKADLHMKSVSTLYPPKEWAKIRAANIRKIGSKHHLETKAIKKNGELIDIDLSVNVLKDSSNNIVGSVGIMHDITERKIDQKVLEEAKQAAEEASTSKSMFLANMSHEVRTPMNTIVGTLDLTLDTDLNDEQRENLLTARDAADNLLSLINDILDLSRVEAGKINLEMLEVNLHNIVKSVCKGMLLLARKKGLDVEWQTDSEIPQKCVGDPVRIRQILVNLINNAVKFTVKGKIRVTAKLESATEDECTVLFSVADNGIGIAEDRLTKVFDVFTQADDSTTRQYGGTGLGLAISKRLVEMMGGKIWVESKELVGSTFSFTAQFKILKKEEFSNSQADRDSESSTVASGNVHDISILLAEDNIVNQKIAVKLLERKGWKVKAVDNGQKVLDILEKEDFDVILMDAQMPILGGLETTKAIREKESAQGKMRIPIIALTARAMADDRKKCMEAGMDGYIAKPIDRDKLYESVVNSVQKREVK